MRKDKEALLNRINQLKKEIRQIPISDDLPDVIEHILNTAPETLNNLENMVRYSTDPQTLDEVYEVILRINSYIIWISGEAGGREIAKNVKSGKEPDKNKPPEYRLNERIAAFLYKNIDDKIYTSLVTEWEGADAIDGKTVYMNPTYLEAFSQWMIHDKIIDKLSKRIIELFAEEHLQNLPADEKDLLQRQLKDKPSVYQIIEMSSKRGKYTVRNFLNNETIEIRDKSSSKVLKQGTIFIGRAIPNVVESPSYYNLLGAIIDIPDKLWGDFALFLSEISAKYYQDNPEADITEFFREHHAQLRRWFLEMTGN